MKSESFSMPTAWNLCWICAWVRSVIYLAGSNKDHSDNSAWLVCSNIFGFPLHEGHRYLDPIKNLVLVIVTVKEFRVGESEMHHEEKLLLKCHQPWIYSTVTSGSVPSELTVCSQEYISPALCEILCWPEKVSVVSKSGSLPTCLIFYALNWSIKCQKQVPWIRQFYIGSEDSNF